jgi:hypothetical protein
MWKKPSLKIMGKYRKTYYRWSFTAGKSHRNGEIQLPRFIAGGVDMVRYGDIDSFTNLKNRKIYIL